MRNSARPPQSRTSTFSNRPATAGSTGARFRRARPLADLIDATIAESCRQRGLASVEIVTRWAEIVGEALSARAVPIKLVWPTHAENGDSGVLHVRVEGGFAIEIQHEAPVIIERVNRYFGWRCIGRLALRQGPVPRPRPARPRFVEPEAASCEAIARHLQDDIGSFEDPALACALARLGALIARESRQGKSAEPE